MQEFVGDHAFWIALIQIIGIDIVLSGDNAVVIALAARSLPEADRRRAVMWGSSAAVVMRVTLTIVAAELLRLPLLKAAGAGLLLWIAVQLLLPEDEGEGEGEAIKGGFFAAIKTIMLADLVMSMDNVVAIAGASKGSLLLLVLGLGLSIPLVVFSSTFLMKVMERFPIVVTGGAALLGFVAGEMVVNDLLLGPWIDANAAWLHRALPIAGAVFVVGTGKLLAARKARREALELSLGEASPESGTPR
ncbi:MAG: TerC family protein [Zoogloea sp.]|nr:TerC family protein [Zoogloea sp.]MCA0325768.1 TerC family protein [Pseudomonadota bacterium]